ncbi:hypothetical protein D3C86_1833860 [compost metagenome]
MKDSTLPVIFSIKLPVTFSILSPPTKVFNIAPTVRVLSTPALSEIFIAADELMFCPAVIEISPPALIVKFFGAFTSIFP